MSVDNGEPDLTAFLLAAAGVTAICGQKVYKKRAPQYREGDPRPWPYVTWFRSGGPRTTTFCSQDDLVPAQYQVDSYSDDADEPEVLARAIRLALVDYMGPMGPVRINTIKLANDFDFGPELEPGVFRRTQLYTITYLET